MKFLAPLALILMASPAAAQQQSLKISGREGVSGTATLSQRLTPDGNKVIQMTMRLKGANGQPVTVLTESSYSPTGRPLRKLQRTSLPGGRLVQSITAQFGAKEVLMTIQNGQEKKTARIALPQGAIEAKSEFWFIRDQVQPGASNTYQRLDLSTQSWVKTASVYKGKSNAKVGTKTVEGQLVISEDVKTWIGPKGRILRMEARGLILEDAG